MMKSNVFWSCVIVAIILASCIPYTSAIPHRQKRVSDQRLAELETLLALSKMRGKLVTVPIGFGRIDPAKIGRRRRRSSQNALKSEMSEAEKLMDYDDLDDQNELTEGSGDVEERSGSSPQYEDLLRQYLLAWAREEEYIENSN